MRSRESRELGDFLHQGDDILDVRGNSRSLGSRLLRKAAKKLVVIRIIWNSRRRPALKSNSALTRYDSEEPICSPATLPYKPPPLITIQDLPDFAFELLPDFEQWIKELWADFLIEPTPYLVASAISYVGFLMLLTRYYAAIWHLSCFLLEFMPWDDGMGL